MTLIAVSQRVAADPATGERRDALDQRWASFLTDCGLTPVLLPNHLPTAQTILAALPIAGLILTGGNTLAAYGGDAPERDAVEVAALELAMAKGWPVVGVCRGMQVLQHYFGVPLGPVTGHVQPQQTITVAGGRREVNSYHGFGSTESVPALTVWARAEDGVVKAVCHTDLPVQGIMWHPERLEPFPQEDLAFFRQTFTG
jgi:putative glutamine amidotransferase